MNSKELGTSGARTDTIGRVDQQGKFCLFSERDVHIPCNPPTAAELIYVGVVDPGGC